MSATKARGVALEPPTERQRRWPDSLTHHGGVDDLQPEIRQPDGPLRELWLWRSGGGGGFGALESREAAREQRVGEGIRGCGEHVGLARRVSCWAYGDRLCLREEQQTHRVHVACGEGFLHARREGARQTSQTSQGGEDSTRTSSENSRTSKCERVDRDSSKYHRESW